MDLSTKAGTLLTFKLKGNIAGGDFLYVETSVDALNWTNRSVLLVDAAGNEVLFDNGISGTASDWLDATVDLGLLDGKGTAYFRFRFVTDGSGTADGFYIDNVVLSAASVQDIYQFLNGTSTATPHVVGLAALVWSHSPTLSASEVKGRILSCVDRVTDLSEKVVTWGRINAFNSLRNLPASPVGLSATAASNRKINLTWANTYFGQIGFSIERKDDGGSFTEIANLTTNTTFYNDPTVPAGTHSYRVRAYIGSNFSVYSGVVSVTTS
jgi:subtilisin family serine protease